MNFSNISKTYMNNTSNADVLNDVNIEFKSEKAILKIKKPKWIK